MQGGHNRKAANAPKATALSKWPRAPRSFNDSERGAWNRLGRSLLPLRTISASDLLLVELTSQQLARWERMRADPDSEDTALNALGKDVAKCLNDLGLSPKHRPTVEALPDPEPEDELSEY